MRSLKRIIHQFGQLYCKEVCRREYNAQNYPVVSERPVEYRFVFEALMKNCPQNVLDVGTGTTALPHLMQSCGFNVTAIDNVVDCWPDGMFNRHYHIINDDITDTRLTGRYDFITCVSVLEHIENFNQAVNSMFALLNRGGLLLLTFPYNETKFIENIYSHPDASYGKEFPYICRVYSRNEIDTWLQGNSADLLIQEYWQIFSGEYWTFGKRKYPPLKVEKSEKHHLTCLLINK